MAEICKPELSEQDKARANEIFRYLKKKGGDGYCTKEELCRAIGWEYNNSRERQVRELISMIAKVKPVISTSDKRGYKLAKTTEDIEAVLHAENELASRIAEMCARREQLRIFLDRLA